MWHRIKALFRKPKPKPIKINATFAESSTFTKEQVRKLIEDINRAVSEAGPDGRG